MEIDRTIFHPDYKQEPYWWEAARPGTKFAVDLPKEMEIFIIGSGYSGLSAALELAREGRDVSVVDALAFGEAASSRNGGGVSAGVRRDIGRAGPSEPFGGSIEWSAFGECGRVRIRSHIN